MAELRQDFALVAEGSTDQRVLQNILTGFFQMEREPDVNFEQPNPALQQGGWTLVMQYLRNRKFVQAFQTNQYLIIQVDTDVAADAGFDVPTRDANGPLPPHVLVEKVTERLEAEIGAEHLQTYGDRFIFAVAVEESECWILPLWFADESRSGKTTLCLRSLGHCQQLREAFTRKNLPWITEKRKEPDSYDFASAGYRKRKTLLGKGPRNPSLKVFLGALEARQIVLPPVD